MSNLSTYLLNIPFNVVHVKIVKGKERQDWFPVSSGRAVVLALLAQPTTRSFPRDLHQFQCSTARFLTLRPPSLPPKHQNSNNLLSPLASITTTNSTLFPYFFLLYTLSYFLSPFGPSYASSPYLPDFQSLLLSRSSAFVSPTSSTRGTSRDCAGNALTILLPPLQLLLSSIG
ncbi:hypothetical protein BT63DRAFT_281815 [Microthyrium microscopicum]|uniref:Uncharacterized protein n=1 Tax=Microthyrium microscopicum TaxID=703497 RepID=A0A6A6UB05_9PEZI|nr:hypothetical protein BT63DRAFT_281815 [Microthyrium microscopicum]